MNSFVELYYKGYVADTKEVFDETPTSDNPILLHFSANNLISCWLDLSAKMYAGNSYRLYCPANTAYGNQDLEKIPANSDLIFEIEIIKIYKNTIIETIQAGNNQTFPDPNLPTIIRLTSYINDEEYRHVNEVILYNLHASNNLRCFVLNIPQMSLGQISMLDCPYKLAYGKKGYAKNGIKPKTDLKYKIEILDIWIDDDINISEIIDDQNDDQNDQSS